MRTFDVFVLATAFLVSFTLPPRVGPNDRVGGIRSFQSGGGIDSLKLWANSGLNVPYKPDTTQVRQLAYIWTNFGVRDVETIRIWATNSGGRAPDSNLNKIATGLPDTIVWMVRGHAVGPLWTFPVLSEPRNAVGGTQGWALAYGDSAAVDVRTNREILIEMRAYLCSLGTCP